jgi:hypothetical protein
MTEIIEIIAIDSQRNGSGGAPFITAIVDMKLDNHVRRLSISFAYTVSDQGYIDGVAKDEDGCTICFVLDLEGLFEDELNRHYRGDRIAWDHGQELIAEYQKRFDAKYGV